MKTQPIEFTKVNTDVMEYPKYTADLDIPESVEEACEMWTPEVVLQKAVQSTIIDFQGAGRRHMTKTEGEGDDAEEILLTQDEVREKLADFKPKLRAAPKTKVERAQDIFKNMSAEEMQAALAALNEMSEEAT